MTSRMLVIDVQTWSNIKQYIPADWWSFNNELQTLESYNLEQGVITTKLSQRLGLCMDKACEALEEGIKELRIKNENGVMTEHDAMRYTIKQELQKFLLSAGYERKV